MRDTVVCDMVKCPRSGLHFKLHQALPHKPTQIYRCRVQFGKCGPHHKAHIAYNPRNVGVGAPQKGGLLQGRHWAKAALIWSGSTEEEEKKKKKTTCALQGEGEGGFRRGLDITLKRCHAPGLVTESRLTPCTKSNMFQPHQ